MKLKKKFTIRSINSINFIMFMLLCIILLLYIYNILDFINYLGLDVQMFNSNININVSEWNVNKFSGHNSDDTSEDGGSFKEFFDRKYEKPVFPITRESDPVVNHIVNEAKIIYGYTWLILFTINMIDYFFGPGK